MRCDSIAAGSCMPTDTIEIKAYDPDRHLTRAFSCGIERLDNFIKITAKKQQKGDMVRVYVAVNPDDDTVLGYSVINVGHIDISDLPARPKAAPAHGDIPVLFLSRIATDQRMQGQGIGQILMIHALEKARLVALHAGCHAAILDVITDGGTEAYLKRLHWYQNFGFTSFPSEPTRMFLLMKDIRAMLED